MLEIFKFSSKMKKSTNFTQSSEYIRGGRHWFKLKLGGYGFRKLLRQWPFLLFCDNFQLMIEMVLVSFVFN